MEPFFFILVARVSLWSITLIKLFCLVPIKQVLFVWYPQTFCTGFCFTLETLITHDCISRVSDKASYFISQLINGAVRFWLPLCTYNKRFYQWSSLSWWKQLLLPKGYSCPQSRLMAGNGNPLQYCFLKNSMDRGTRQAIVHGVTESDTTKQLILPNYTPYIAPKYIPIKIFQSIILLKDRDSFLVLLPGLLFIVLWFESHLSIFLSS